jgi:choline dehydrogenase-like flavoprotein
LTQQYDYIVVGAGSAGCVIAARLTEDPEVSVLLLEAGGSDRTMLCRTPGMMSILHVIPQLKKKVDWGFKTTPRAQTLQREIPYFRGKLLGGSSAINGMVFVRGHRQNFDDWEADGCPGWGYQDVLPYFKKLESFEDGETAHRGGSGPIHVTRSTVEVSPISVAFGEAVMKTCGVPWNDDYNGAEQEGVARVQVNAKGGLRYSTSEGYLHPNLARPNLHLQSGATVHKVMLEGTRAVGVQYQVGGQMQEARVSQEVVLSGGAIGSPQILMLSGIGPAAHLAEHGLEVAADLPVGQNLHDHLFLPLVFLAPNAGHTGTGWHFLKTIVREKLRPGSTWFSRTVFETMAWLKTSASQPIPNLQIHTLPWSYPAPNRDNDHEIPKVDPRGALTVEPTLIYPKSRGEVRLRSADPTDKPHIDPHFLEHPDDVVHLLDGVDLCREIMGSKGISPQLDGEFEPGAAFQDRQAMARELPNRVATVYHPVGTCRMGSDERAVVDPQLRVLGIRGLRVADASIMPSVTGGNTNAPSIMIGERAVDLILADRR